MPDKDGSSQDAAIESRLITTQSEKAFARAVQLAFGDIELAPQEVSDLEEVYYPFDWDGPEDFASVGEEMTQEEYESLRNEYFDTVARLRPTFLRLFKVKENYAAYLACDLYNMEVENIDAFLLAAFRLRVVF